MGEMGVKMWVNIKDAGVRNRMRGEFDAKPDELTFRLMCLMEAKTDVDVLKRVHDNRKGCTRAEVGEYVRLWELADEIG